MSSAKSKLKSFGKIIRSQREELGISQQDLAAEAGVDRSYMGGVERGERNISLLNILKISQALKVKPSKLFAGMDNG